MHSSAPDAGGQGENPGRLPVEREVGFLDGVGHVLAALQEIKKIKKLSERLAFLMASAMSFAALLEILKSQCNSDFTAQMH